MQVCDVNGRTVFQTVLEVLKWGSEPFSTRASPPPAFSGWPGFQVTMSDGAARWLLGYRDRSTARVS
jgi:hypothetical protein